MTAATVRALPTFNGLTAPPVKPVRWTVEGFLARGAGTLLFGQPGVSKSVHTAYLVACLVAGVPFAHLKTEGVRLRVLYLDFDSAWDWNAELFAAAFRGVGLESIPEGFHYFSPQTEACRFAGEDAPPILALEKLGPAIAQTVREQKIDVVVCDSLGQMMTGDTNSGQDVAMALRLGLNPARREGAAVLVIDHATKAAAGGAGIPTPMGSQQKRAWARVSVALEQESSMGDNVTRWTVDKTNTAPFTPFLTRACFTSGAAGLERVEVDYLGEAGPRMAEQERLQRKAEGEQGILAALEAGPLSRTALQRESGVSGGTFDRVMRSLEQVGKITRQERGLYALPE